jgi:hypothetical protein
VTEAVSVTAPLSKGTEQFVVHALMPAGFEETDPVPLTTTVRVGRLKFAVTLVSWFKLKSQGPVALLQFAVMLPVPLVQLVKFDALSGMGMIEIRVPTGYLPQEPGAPPFALHWTVPPPRFAEAEVAVTKNCVTFNVKLAVTVEFAFRVTGQVPIPVQLMLPVPLLQPVKVEPESAVAVSVIGVPPRNCAEQEVPQLIPPWFDITVPVPLPDLMTDSVEGGGATGNVAVTEESAPKVIEHVPVPEQLALPVPLLHPVNPVPIAVNVTTAPIWKAAEQVPDTAVQLMIPAGVDVTVPPLMIVTLNILSDAWSWVVATRFETSAVPEGRADWTSKSKLGSVNGGTRVLLNPVGSGW